MLRCLISTRKSSRNASSSGGASDRNWVDRYRTIAFGIELNPFARRALRIEPERAGMPIDSARAFERVLPGDRPDRAVLCSGVDVVSFDVLALWVLADHTPCAVTLRLD